MKNEKKMFAEKVIFLT